MKHTYEVIVGNIGVVYEGTNGFEAAIRASYVEGSFLFSALDVANKILEEHGQHTETAKTAQQCLADYKSLIAYQCQMEADLFSFAGSERDWETIVGIYAEYWPGDLDTEEIDDDFLRSLCEDYRILLQREYDYLTSREAILETIELNDYEFTEDGDLA